MAGSKGKRDTGKYLQKLYLLLRRLDQNRRQQILAGLSEVQRRELERWMLEYKSTQNHGDQVQALTPDWSRRAGKFFSLRGAQEHLLFASIGKQRTPIKVAIVCAIVTTIITYLLYKVYVDSMLRRRSEHQEEEEVTKPKAVPKSPKRERSSKALAAKPDESKLCCYDGLMRFASSRGTVEAKASRPNFSGTWSCVKAEGDLDGLYAAMGLGYFARCALERAQWGAGHLSRTYEHQGDHVKLVQKATEETTQEFDINGTPQKVSQGDGVVIQTTSWDDEEEGVLLFETKDLLGCDPNSWTHCRQYLQGEELVIEVRGARGHRAVWTYHRALS